MKPSVQKRIKIMCVYTAVFLFVTPFAVSAEKIDSFDTEIIINMDGTITVVESIAYDFEGQEKRGIFRAIPLSFTVDEEKRKLKISPISVERNNAPEPFTIEKNGSGEWRIRIGDPNIFHTGVHTYEATYTVSGAIRYFSNLDELYWNVTGADWTVPIESWSARYILPSDISLIQQNCYQGNTGFQSPCAETGVSAWSGGRLSPGQESTVAVGFTPGVINELVHKDFSFVGLVIALASFPLFYLTLIIRFFIHRMDPKNKVVITQFGPYKEYSTLLSSHVWDGKFKDEHLGPAIIALAQKGYITIKVEEGSGFKEDVLTITQQRDDLEKLLPIQEKVLYMLFGNRAGIGTVFNSSEHVIAIDYYNDVSRLLDTQVEKEAFSEKAGSIRWYVIGTILLGILGLYIAIGSIFLALYIAVFGVVFLFVPAMIGVKKEKPTQHYHDVKHYLKGLRHYIKVAEQEKIAFHDVPEKNPQSFSELLPYAMMFGLEKEWARAFSGVLSNLDWLEGDLNTKEVVKAVAFVTNNISRNVQSAQPRVSRTSSRSYSSSRSSSSGSGSRGRSGGGSGGGGGGSW